MSTSIAFIDARLADYKTLSAGLPAEVEIILIEGGNGLQQRAAAPAGPRNGSQCRRA
jgi:hypothetical protein